MLLDSFRYIITATELFPERYWRTNVVGLVFREVLEDKGLINAMNSHAILQAKQLLQLKSLCYSKLLII